MQHPFFKETAEEMVNRLFDEWLKEKTFANNIPLTIPEYKKGVITRLKSLDDFTSKYLKNHLNADYTDCTELEIMLDKKLDEQMIKTTRENFVLLDLTKMFADFFQRALTNHPPKPTHRQTRLKQNHLRLVVNG